MNGRTLFFLAPLALALLLLHGCASVTVTKTPNVETVAVSNSGLFLFGGVPIFSGDPDYPNRDTCSWFVNTVKLETNVRLLNEAAASAHARGVTDIVSHVNEEPIIAMILKRRIFYTSARLTH